MALDERKHRPAPQRDGPRRAIHARTNAVNGKAIGAARSADEPQAADTVIGAAVSTAYRVVEDNVQEGRRAAARLRAAAPPLSEPPPNTKAVANRLMHMTKDLGATWIDLIVAVLREPEVRAFLDRVAPHDRVRPEPEAARAAQMSITHRVSSRNPVEVTLSLLPGLNSTVSPGIAGLHSLNPASPPIRQVAFTMRPGGGLELHIEVPDDHPSGAYAGTVMDMDSQQPIGTLAVRVLG